MKHRLCQLLCVLLVSYSAGCSCKSRQERADIVSSTALSDDELRSLLMRVPSSPKNGFVSKAEFTEHAESTAQSLRLLNSDAFCVRTANGLIRADQSGSLESLRQEFGTATLFAVLDRCFAESLSGTDVSLQADLTAVQIHGGKDYALVCFAIAFQCRKYEDGADRIVRLLQELLRREAPMAVDITRCLLGRSSQSSASRESFVNLFSTSRRWQIDKSAVDNTGSGNWDLLCTSPLLSEVQ